MLKAAVWPGLRSREEKRCRRAGMKKEKAKGEKGNTRCRGRAAGRKPTLPITHSAGGGGLGPVAEAGSGRPGATGGRVGIRTWVCIRLGSYVPSPPRSRKWNGGMAGLRGARMRGLGCPVWTFGEGGQLLKRPICWTLIPSFLRPSSAPTWKLLTDSLPFQDCSIAGESGSGFRALMTCSLHRRTIGSFHWWGSRVAQVTREPIPEATNINPVLGPLQLQ